MKTKIMFKSLMLLALGVSLAEVQAQSGRKDFTWNTDGLSNVNGDWTEQGAINRYVGWRGGHFRQNNNGFLRLTGKVIRHKRGNTKALGEGAHLRTTNQLFAPGTTLKSRIRLEGAGETKYSWGAFWTLHQNNSPNAKAWDYWELDMYETTPFDNNANDYRYRDPKTFIASGAKYGYPNSLWWRRYWSEYHVSWNRKNSRHRVYYSQNGNRLGLKDHWNQPERGYWMQVWYSNRTWGIALDKNLLKVGTNIRPMLVDWLTWSR